MTNKNIKEWSIVLVIRGTKIRATKDGQNILTISKCWWGCTVTGKFTLLLWRETDTTNLEASLAICDVADNFAFQPEQISFILLPYWQSMSPIIEIPNIKYSLCKPPLQFREPCAPILANKIQGGSTEATEGGLWEGCYSLIRRLAGKAVMPIPLLSVPGDHDTRM